MSIWLVIIPPNSTYTLPGGYLAIVEGRKLYEVDGREKAREAYLRGCPVYHVKKHVGIHEYYNCHTLKDVLDLIGITPGPEQAR